jgi:hypothetical protein
MLLAVCGPPLAGSKTAVREWTTHSFRLHAEMSSMEPDGLEYLHPINPTGSGRISHYTVSSSTVSAKESFLWLS